MTQFEVLNKIIDSRDFTVGGGSAAALAGAMAAGLIGMVARLSIKKEYGLSKEDYMTIANKADELSSELLEGMVKDTESFKKIKEAYAMPKETENDKSVRSLAIEKAAVGAALVPLCNGKLSKEVFELGFLLKDKSNPNAASDLEEGNLLVNAAILGCVLNIEANLPLIKDENIKEKFKQEINCLEQYSKKYA